MTTPENQPDGRSEAPDLPAALRLSAPLQGAHDRRHRLDDALRRPRRRHPPAAAAHLQRHLPGPQPADALGARRPHRRAGPAARPLRLSAPLPLGLGRPARRARPAQRRAPPPADPLGLLLLAPLERRSDVGGRRRHPLRAQRPRRGLGDRRARRVSRHRARRRRVLSRPAARRGEPRRAAALALPALALRPEGAPLQPHRPGPDRRAHRAAAGEHPRPPGRAGLRPRGARAAAVRGGERAADPHLGEGRDLRLAGVPDDGGLRERRDRPGRRLRRPLGDHGRPAAGGLPGLHHRHVPALRPAEEPRAGPQHDPDGRRRRGAALRTAGRGPRHRRPAGGGRFRRRRAAAAPASSTATSPSATPPRPARAATRRRSRSRASR